MGDTSVRPSAAPPRCTVGATGTPSSTPTIRLATSPGNAATGTAVELTDEGTGTLVLYGGLPANYDDHWRDIAGYAFRVEETLERTIS